MPDQEATIPGPSVEVVDRLLTRHLPEWRGLPVAPLGEGEDNAAFVVGGALVVRCNTHPEPEERSRRVLREARLLRVVATASPLPVPVPRLVEAHDGCLAYDRLPGRPLLGLDLDRRDATWLGAALGDLIAALSRLPVERMAELAGVDDTPPAEWLAETRDLFPQLAAAVPDRHLPAVLAFLDADPPPPADQLCFAHNDLGIEHVLLDPDTWAITGILDWGDAAVTDPARDLGLILRDLGSSGLDAALTACGDIPGLDRRRIGFFARCALLEDVAYGLEQSRPAYVTNSLRALQWLFPAHEPAGASVAGIARPRSDGSTRSDR